MTVYAVLGYAERLEQWVLLSVHSKEEWAKQAIKLYKESQHFETYDVTEHTVDAFLD